MTIEEFEELSPGMARDLWVAWLADQRRQDLRAAVICCIMGGGKPGDYFPSLTPPLPTDEQMAAKIDSVLR